MATKRVINKKTKCFTGTNIATYVNKKRGTNFTNLTQAITRIGLSAIVIAATGPISAALANVLYVSGLSISVGSLISLIEGDFDTKKLQTTILNETSKKGGALQVTTELSA
ncbi:hypothetical protein MKZ02_22510 [Pseudobacillus sp. FSL P4-0506]|uniref:hypothetical protein n=1 Tax=unclassified Pseudobacillus TaxID=2619284 RepID=UPI0030F5714D